MTSVPSTTVSAVSTMSAALREIARQRERGGERDHAAHAAPRREDALLDRRPGPVAEPPIHRLDRAVVDRHHEHDAHAR